MVSYQADQQSPIRRDRWRPARIAFWASLVLALTVAISVGSSLDRCDPQGNLIAFHSYRSGRDGLYAVDADLGTVCRLNLVNGGGSIGSNHVAWSPDGNKLAWIDDNQLFVQGVSDPAPTTLTERVTGYEWPMAWAPDGSRIAILTFDYNGVLTLAIVTLTQPPTLRSMVVVERPVSDPNSPPPSSELMGSRLAWSPDGRSLLLDVGRRMLQVDVDSAATRVLIPSGRQPAWSPDGRQIAYTNDAALMIAAANGTGARVLAEAGERPVWSPDGAWIAFLTIEGVAVVKPDGTGERLVFRGGVTPMNENNAASYAWSPDSRRLVVLGYERTPLSSAHAMSVVQLADGYVRELVSRGVNRMVAWRPGP